MKHIFSVAAASAFLVGASLTSSAWAADVAQGKKIVQEHCTACHGTEVYSRPNHRMKSLDMLHAQIGRCQKAAGVKLTKQQADDVVAYLNQTFYKFK